MSNDRVVCVYYVYLATAWYTRGWESRLLELQVRDAAASEETRGGIAEIFGSVAESARRRDGSIHRPYYSLSINLLCASGSVSTYLWVV